VRSPAAAAFVLVTLTMASPSVAVAGCGEECDARYSSDIDDCRLQYGDDPADADDLANCIQEVRDGYRSCLDDCPSGAVSVPRWRKLVARAFPCPRNSSRRFNTDCACVLR
jgi:dissimilatory sulfite reductase (desulfoviridin) alpha/beta subunit